MAMTTRRKPATASRRNITLSPDAVAVLYGSDGAPGVGVVSRYLAQVVEQRDRQWREALDLLRAEGWRPGEILSALDAQGGAPAFGWERAAAGLALDLADYARLRGLRPDLEVDPARWPGLVAAVRDRPDVARAIVTLGAEWWTGSEACDAEVRRAPGR